MCLDRKNIFYKMIFLVIIIILTFNLLTVTSRRKIKRYRFRTKPNPKRICLTLELTLKARYKTCFLRPDSGPCRADIIQWYFDVKQARCYRFYWGGCQGNGNRFESKEACLNHCFLNRTVSSTKIPYFCKLTFDYGSCFGYYPRWGWDVLTKSCRQRLYSGCGGNQNNFQSKKECMATCLSPPNNTLDRSDFMTTCIPVPVPELH